MVADKYDLTTSASLSMARAKVAGYSDAYVEFGTVALVVVCAGWYHNTFSNLKRLRQLLTFLHEVEFQPLSTLKHLVYGCGEHAIGLPVPIQVCD